MTKWYSRDPRLDARWNVIFESDGLSIADLVKRADQSVWKDGVIQAGGWNLDSAIVINEYEFLMTLEQRARNYVTHFRRW
jgi:hypothetical protein